jgi:ADP-heptose:LPS heptosyltransferase
LGNISAEAVAAELLAHCLRDEPAAPALIDELAAMANGAGEEPALEASQALFRGLVEPLADRFERRLVDAYVSLFSRVIARACPEWDAAELAARYKRVRRFRHFDQGPVMPDAVYVLSRVTLGADVAITSVVLDAAKKRFPGAEIYFVGAPKAFELFAADRRIRHLAATYGRSATLRERLAAGLTLREALDSPGAIVIDPDSRLSQLGLLPLCREENYFFFESRAYGGEGNDSLGRLTMRWVAEVFGVADAAPYIAPGSGSGKEPGAIAVSLGVGENPAKRVADPFEERLVAALAKKGLPVVIDRGAGGEEAERVSRAVAGLGSRARHVQTWEGSFAGFASQIARSRLFVGYDSAGQHAAAACGTPLVAVFAGFVSPRMFFRWQPTGPGAMVVVRAGEAGTEEILRQTLAAVERQLGAADR